jgi:hypothetical protein
MKSVFDLIRSDLIEASESVISGNHEAVRLCINDVVSRLSPHLKYLLCWP